MELKEVFEPIIKFIKGFQKKETENSKDKAKERLKLVLYQDRASVSPDYFEMMKKELVEVIKKYVDIDEELMEVELTRLFEDGLDGPALVANIPIKNFKPVAKKVEEKKEEQIAVEEVKEEQKAEEAVETVKKEVKEEKVEEKTEQTETEENKEEVAEEIKEETKTEEVVEETAEEVKKEKTEEQPKEEKKQPVKKETTKKTQSKSKKSTKK